MMLINNKFNIGQLVYLKTDSDNELRMITEIKIMSNGLCMYLACKGVESGWYYEIELSSEPSIIPSN